MGYRLRVTVLIFLLSVLYLAGCTGGGILSPDVDRSKHARSPDYRVVLRGETLYSISWDAGVDFRTLARWNHIGPPYLVRAGQRLRVTDPGSEAEEGEGGAGMYHVVARGDTVYGIARKHRIALRQLIRWNGLKKPYVIHPGQRLQVAKAEPLSTGRGHKHAYRDPVRLSLPHGRIRRVAGWTWPARGAVVNGFVRNGLNKGIDIAGGRDSPIVAAAGGHVVYQGSGLRGYGKLIIIKHNPDFLSAYAHCARILVKEGAAVKRGQRIATMGSSGTNRVKLHFEIRLRGKPVNPLSYLPGRS